MKTTGNTILITGGGSGIGRGLAEAFHALGNQVIISGRRQTLDETARVDVEDPASIRTLAGQIAKDFPNFNVLINNAGIMRAEKFGGDQKVSDAEHIVTTNLLGPIRMTAAFLPLLQKQPYSVIMNVSSGLAFVPLSATPTYCATKAAIHSWTQSLRYQLRNSPTEVIELIPPYLQTDLMNGAKDSRAMPLNDFIAEVMQILKTQPDVKEICVERVKGLRFAAESGKYDDIFNGLNARMTAESL
jgi:uncharacterized oxidoreductase